mgnify:FL=1
MNKIKTRLIAATAATILGTWTSSAALTVRSIAADTISADNIVVPESFEIDTHAMMQSWYLTNYAVLDRNADRRANVPTTDQEYIDRLQRMPAVIEMPYNKIVRAFIDMYVERKKSLVESMLGMSLYYMPIFEQALDKYGMPMELKYLPIIESALNPTAVSRAGATGLWQFMLDTAKGLGLEINSLVDQRRDPYLSSDAAARYLKQLYNSYGDWSLAIAAYNCGPGNVNKALRRAGGGKKDFWEIYPFLPRETRDYIPAFIAANYAMTYYNHHNISPALASRPIVTDTVHVNKRVHFQQISDVMGISMDELRVLNPQYRTDVIPGDIHPYALILPNIQAYCYIANEDSIVNHNAELYARRDVVEPSTGTTVTAGDGGQYVEEVIVKYHKVRRGENLASIARRYGVSQKSIRRTNGIGRRVRRGQTLRINTIQRRYVPAPAHQDSTATPDTKPQVAAADTVPDTKTNETAEPTPQTRQVTDAMSNAKNNDKKNDNGRKNSRKKTESKPVKHKVSSGENLTKIAKRYGVSVDQLRSANNISGDNIQAGQTLTIPSKDVKSGKKSSSKKKSRRRRR